MAGGQVQQVWFISAGILTPSTHTHRRRTRQTEAQETLRRYIRKHGGNKLGHDSSCDSTIHSHGSIHIASLMTNLVCNLFSVIE